jgi:hypothetical protein
MTSGHGGCLVPKKNATDTRGQAHNVFFAHART